MRNKATRPGFNNNVRHSRIVEEHLTGVHLRNAMPAPYVTKVNVRPNHLFRRKSEQPQSIGPLTGAAKRCSGEFDFVKSAHNRRSGDFSSMFMDGSVSQPGTPSGGPGNLNSLHQQFSSMIYTPPAVREEPGPVCVQVRASEQASRDGSAPSTPSRRRGSEGKGTDSPAVVLRRQTGLGRRAVTQIQIQQKKNSYVSAICKSQENLVKVGLTCHLANFNSCLSRNLSVNIPFQLDSFMYPRG